MIKEEWAEIQGIDGAFISNLGRAKSITPYGENLLSLQHRQDSENRVVRLRAMFDRRRTQERAFYITIHVEVAKAFLPTTGSGRVIFRDKNPLNCIYTNLAYMYDFSTFPDHITLSKYSKFKTPLGVAAFHYCLMNRDPIQKEMDRLGKTMPNIISQRFKLSDTEGREAYWEAATKFMMKTPLGFINYDEGAEGLLFTMAKYEAMRLYRNKYKSVSQNQVTDSREYNFMDSLATSSLNGDHDTWERNVCYTA